MLLPAAGVWVVSGRGPGTGSNGAGKTVLLGALSLLNGDPQWRGENGIGPYAARLLFDRKRARLTDARFQDAHRGYIMGAFLDANHLSDAITVIMRIQRHDSPYVQIRTGAGVRFAEGETEHDRLETADRLWEQLRNEGETWGAKDYAESLYGTAPRCLAYIRARGSEDNQDNGLLALGQRPFRPADLASQVITLSGKRNAVADERQLRQELAGEESRLENKKSNYAEQCEREERQLAEIAARARSRDLLSQAAIDWRRFLDVSALVECIRDKELREDLAQLEARIGELRRQISELEKQRENLPSVEELARRYRMAQQAYADARSAKDKLVGERAEKSTRHHDLSTTLRKLRTQAATALGATVDEAQKILDEARSAERDAMIKAGTAHERRKDADAELQRLRVGRGGPAGHALDALDAATIPAASLVDIITLDDDQRSNWEARLSPYAAAVIIHYDDLDNARTVLAAYPGTPILTVDHPVDQISEVRPVAASTLTAFLHELKQRMPTSGPGWVSDSQLHLQIPGGYKVPLTDRHAAILAAEAELARLTQEASDADQVVVDAERHRQAAEELLAGAKAAAEITPVEATLTALSARINELDALIPRARDTEDETQGMVSAAEFSYRNADAHRREITKAIDGLKTDSPDSLSVRTTKAADARERARNQSARAERWRQCAEIRDYERLEAELSQKDIPIDGRTRDTHLHQARTTLRQAIEAVVQSPRTSYTSYEAEPVRPGLSTADDSYLTSLASNLHDLRQSCEAHAIADDCAMPFEQVAKPLTDWLHWYGANDEADEREINDNQARTAAEIAASENEVSEIRQWINSQRNIQVQIITDMFSKTEKRLNELLVTADQDTVRLRPQPIDLGDPSQPLRWELHPQWLPAGGEAVDYTLSPNTAELIILHVLLAASSLVAASRPQGRMIILDESGNNLDGPNLTRVAAILKRVAGSYGLTIVLACQDLYADRVAEHGAALTKLLRPRRADALNAPPVVVHGPDDPAVIELLATHLKIGRS